MASAASAAIENPWTQPTDAPPAPPEPAPLPRPSVKPHRGVDAPTEGLAISADGAGGALVVVGCHGGAGESTLAALIPGAVEASHAWPAANSDSRVRVLLCARTSASGLDAASAALSQWAAGVVRVELVGLVLIADAPGRLPRALRDRARVIEGGAPTVWRIPWIAAWREGRSGTHDQPRAVRRLLEDLGT